MKKIKHDLISPISTLFFFFEKVDAIISMWLVHSCLKKMHDSFIVIRHHPIENIIKKYILFTFYNISLIEI